MALQICDEAKEGGGCFFQHATACNAYGYPQYSHKHQYQGGTFLPGGIIPSGITIGHFYFLDFFIPDRYNCATFITLSFWKNSCTL